MLKSTLLVIGAAAVLFTVGFALRDRDGAAMPARDSASQLVLGRAIYDRQCASCHGAQLEGQPNWRERQPNGRLPAPPHDASGHTWHHPDSVLFGITKKGLEPYAPPGYQSDMPGFAGRLSDREIEAILAYIKSTWPPDIQARQAAITEQSKKHRP